MGLGQEHWGGPRQKIRAEKGDLSQAGAGEEREEDGRRKGGDVGNRESRLGTDSHVWASECLTPGWETASLCTSKPHGDRGMCPLHVGRVALQACVGCLHGDI